MTVEEVLEQAMVDKRIKDWKIETLGKVEQLYITFNNRRTILVQGSSATDPIGLQKFIEGNAFEASLLQWTKVREVIKRKAIKKYGFIARNWFA